MSLTESDWFLRLLTKEKMSIIIIAFKSQFLGTWEAKCKQNISLVNKRNIICRDVDDSGNDLWSYQERCRFIFKCKGLIWPEQESWNVKREGMESCQAKAKLGEEKLEIYLDERILQVIYNFKLFGMSLNSLELKIKYQ